jgi:hypothetical protein
MMKACALLVLAGLVGNVHAQETPEAPRDSDIRQEFAKQMKIVASTLRRAGEPSLAIGQITGPPSFPSSSGAGLALILADELEKNGIKVKTRANLGLRGVYYLSEASWGPFLPGKNRLAVAVKLSIVDIEDKVPFPNLKDIECILAGETPVLTLLAPPVRLPDQTTISGGQKLEVARDETLRRAIQQPKVAIRENMIQSEDDSAFAVQVLVDGKAIDVKDDEGLAYLQLHPEKPFAVKLINRSKNEAAVRLAIDGIDVFAFSEDRIPMGPRKGEPRFSVFVVGKGESFVVNGWYVNEKHTEPFRLKGYAKDAVALARHNDALGTITARFSAAWDAQDVPAAGEPPGKRKGGMPVPEPESSPGMQTGAVNRHVGVVRSVISARFKKQ